MYKNDVFLEFYRATASGGGAWGRRGPGRRGAVGVGVPVAEREELGSVGVSRAERRGPTAAAVRARTASPAGVARASPEGRGRRAQLGGARGRRARPGGASGDGRGGRGARGARRRGRAQRGVGERGADCASGGR